MDEKNKIGLITEAAKSEPWDWQYLYQLERKKIEQMIAYFEEHPRYVDVEYDIRDMKICLSLLSIILEEKPLCHFNGDINFVECDELDENGDKLYELVKTADYEKVVDVKVNIKNLDRIITEPNLKEYYEKNPDEYYIRKAEYLYHKIRFEKSKRWWN